MKQKNTIAFIRSLILMITICCWQSAISQKWTPVKGIVARDMSMGEEGNVWVVAKDNSILHWNGSVFEKIKGTALRISVSPDGIPWIVSNTGRIGYFDQDQDQWSFITGMARDIAAGPDGVLWAVSNKAMEGGFEIRKWDGAEWHVMPGAGVRIAVDPSGLPWIVNDSHQLFRYNEDDEEEELPGEIQDIDIGGDGTVWAVNTNNEILKWVNEEWEVMDGRAKAIAVNSNGVPWILNETNMVSKLASLVSEGEEDSDEEETEADSEEKETSEIKPPKSRANPQKPADVKQTRFNPDNNQQPNQIKDEHNSNDVKPKGRPATMQRPGTPVPFENTGFKPVTIYTSSATTLGDSVISIRPKSTVSIPVNIGDEYEVAIGGEIGTHPKIYITNTKYKVKLYGNDPIKSLPGYIAEKYVLLDYQSNILGVDLTTYSPRDLVNTISKGKIFEAFDLNNGIDYHIPGSGVVMKRGFDYAGTSLHEGSNEVTMSYGYSSFAKNWGINLGGSGTIPIPKTPASVTPALDFGYKEQESEDRSYENSYAFTREQRSVFVVTVDPKEAPLESAFKDAVLNVTDMTTANEFVEYYGTHYPKTIHYGGDRSVCVVMTKQEYSKAKGFGIDVKGKIGLSIGKKSFGKGFGKESTSQKGTKDSEIAEGHFGIDYSENREEQSALEKATARYRIVGGSGGFDSWDVNENNATPVSAQLELIYTLIDPLIFKDNADPAQLAKARGLIETAVANKIRSMPLLNAPIPPPNVYTIIIERLEVTKELDDANKNTKGNFTAGISWEENGKTVATEETPMFCEFPEYSLDFKFVKGNVIYPNKEYSVTDFADPKTGKFRTMKLNIRGLIDEKDDLVGDPSDEMYGETGPINIPALNLSPGQVSEAKTFYLEYKAFAHENQIKVTYKIRREPSEFSEKLLKW